MKTILKTATGLIISALCLWLVLRNFHFHDLILSINRASIPLLLLALPVYLSAFFLRSVRWQIILSPIKKMSAFRLFPILSFGYLINNVLPARAGEIARCMALAKSENMSTGSALGSVFAERVADGGGLIYLLLICLTLFPVSTFPLFKVASFITLGLALGWILLYFWNKYRSAIKTKMSDHNFFLKILDFFWKFTEGLIIFKSPTKLLLVALLTIVIWTIEITTIMTLSHGFKLYLSLSQSAGLMAGIIFGVLIPAAPGYIGTYELFGQKTLSLMGFDKSVALSFILSLHFFQIVLSSILGIPVLFNKKAMPNLSKIAAFFKTQ